MNSQTDVAAALRCLIEPGTVFEIRIPEPTNAYGTQAGYFDDFAAAAKAATTWSGKCSAVYITPNPVAPALLARAHNRIKKLGKKDRPRQTPTSACGAGCWWTWTPFVPQVFPAATPSTPPPWSKQSKSATG